jgi:hypothetical protein
MAISETHYRLLQELHRRGELPQGGSILEIGEANFYGDFNPVEIPGSSLIEQGDNFQYQIVKQIYKNLFGTDDISAIDMNGPNAEKLDLNTLDPVLMLPNYNACFNHGTSEHIFNIANVFQLMHKATRVGGLMIHESPFTGWVDHGFYCLQPTLFWDLAAANNYQIVLFALEHLASKTAFDITSRDDIHEMARREQLPGRLMCFVVFRKLTADPFKIPMQGVYAGTAGEKATQAWKDLR